jgi:hypothetical protein
MDDAEVLPPGTASGQRRLPVGREVNIVRLRSFPAAADQLGNYHRADTWRADKESELSVARVDAEQARTAFHGEATRTPPHRHLLLPVAVVMVWLLFLVELAPSYWSAQAAMPTETQARVAAVFIDVCLIGLAWVLVRATGVWRWVAGFTVAMVLAGLFVLRAVYMAEMGMPSPLLNATLVTAFTAFIVAAAHYAFAHREPWALFRRRVARWRTAAAVGRLATELDQHERRTSVEGRACDVYTQYHGSSAGTHPGDQAGGRPPDDRRDDPAPGP